MYSEFKIFTALDDTFNATFNEIKNFIHFVLEFDKFIIKYENEELKFETDSEKMSALLRKNNLIYFNGFVKSESRIKRFTAMADSINDRLATNSSILQTLENENIRTRSEYDNVRHTTNVSKKYALQEKLKQLQDQTAKYTNSEKEMKKELSEINSFLSSINENMVEYVFEYLENVSHIKVLSGNIKKLVSNIDDIFSNDITNCLIKYNLMISNFVNFEELNRLFKLVVEKLTRILNTHEVPFKIDSIRTAFLNCNYFEQSVLNNNTYKASKGFDIMSNGKIEPSFHVKCKSFRTLNLFYEKINLIESNYTKLYTLESTILENPSANKIKDQKTYLGLIGIYCTIAQLLYDFVYGDNIILSEYPAFGGLYEKGCTSYAPHFSKLSGFISDWENKKNTNFYHLKEAYWSVIKTLYKIVAISSLSRLKITEFPEGGVENLLKNYSDNFVPIEKEFETKNTIHHRINKRAKLKKK